MNATLPHIGTATSEAAAIAALPKVKRDRRLMCEFIAKRGARGATDDELFVDLGHEIHVNAIRARRGECWAYGYLTDSLGEVRKTQTGCMAKVWHATKSLIEKLGMPAGSWCAP